ncbi:hypothetical protein [Clostridium botulinum]|uniref:hypothetical protein n=1 Tax=Clostridium botulinum TaxID=1491 RepID=UPI001CBBC948|nr:hypothetical protein [Clostridium botulinum]
MLLLENLLLKTGITNVVNISKHATVDTTLTGTTAQTKTLETLSIDLNSTNSSVLLDGVIDFTTTDANAGTELGPLSLQIIRTVDGNSTTVLTQTFRIQNINYLASSTSFKHFKFHWLDVNPTSSLCPATCIASSGTCPAATITYSFNLTTPGLGSATQVSGVVIDDFYSLTVAEIPKQS